MTRRLRLPKDPELRFLVVGIGLFVAIGFAVVVASATSSPTIKALAFVVGLVAILAIGWIGNDAERLVRIAAHQTREIRRIASNAPSPPPPSGPFIEPRVELRARTRRLRALIRASVPLALIAIYVWIEVGRHLD